MSKVFKGLKKVAAVALPIAGAYFGGPIGAAAGSAIGSKLNGGSWGDALKAGALSGLTSGVMGAGGQGFGGLGQLGGFLDSANSGIMSLTSPLNSLLNQGVNAVSGAFGGSGKGGLSNISSMFGGNSSAGTAANAASKAASTYGPTLPGDSSSFFGPSLNPLETTATSSGSGILDKLKSALGNTSLKDVASVAQLAQMLQDPTPDGMRTQEQILAQMNADRAKQAEQSQAFIASLNTAPTQRVQTSQPIDYYNYGSRPEQKFFDNVALPPIKYAEGGKVSKSPLGGLGGQDDTVDIKASEGEYVISADVVSALGDGNTAAGAKALDHMMKMVRKKVAPAMKAGKLPPKSMNPLSYLGAH